MTGLLPAERAAELAEGPVTIDIDATDVEVYGNKKRGVAYTYQGQRPRRTWQPGPRPRSRWPPTCWPGIRPRSSAVALLGRALAALPQLSGTGRGRPGGRSRCAPTPGTSPGTWPAPPPRRT